VDPTSKGRGGKNGKKGGGENREMEGKVKRGRERRKKMEVKR